MTTSCCRRFVGLFLVAAALALLQPKSASALPGAQASCRDAIADSVTKYAASAAKVIARCHQRRSAGQRSLAVDCNDAAVADDSGKLQAQAAAARSEIVSACADADELLGNYVECPAPAAHSDDGGASAGIDDFGEVGDCLLALGAAHAGLVSRASEGRPSAALTAPLRKCQTGLGKGTARILKSTMSERRRCQQQVDETSSSMDYACSSSDPRGRVYTSLTRYQAKVAPICTFSPDVLDDLDACSDDAGELPDCSGMSAIVHAGALIRDAYVLAPDNTTTTLPGMTTTTLLPDGSCGESYPQCDGSCPPGRSCETNGSTCSCVVDGTGPCAPAMIHRKILSRFSELRESFTALNAGWSGIAQGIDVPDGAGDFVDVDCDDNCENCQVSLHTAPVDGASICRCTSNAAQTCDVINGSDPEHCGSLDPTCRCFFGSPLPITSAGNPACVALRIRDDHAGTMNLRTGEWHDEMHIAAVVYLGITTTDPCPTCEGDPVPNDGVRGGTCSDGLGTACDVNGAHSTFGKVSNDCLPPSASNISGTGLIINLNLSTDQVALGATLPCDTPAGKLCHCRTCTGNTNLACSSDAQCAAIGAGTCTGAGGAGVRLNQCTNFECGASGDCTIGPIDRYCDGKLYPDGRGYVPCTSNNDCSSSEAGTCTANELRRCFPDPIVYNGLPDLSGPTSVSAFCVAPTSNPAINIAAGLPGPGALLVSFDNEAFCQNDTSIPYEFPSGANCEEIGGGTTTTLLPLPQCEDADSPVCGGLCPTGQTCGDSSGVCTCTGLPVPSCEDATSPVCGGICPGTGELCTDTSGTCSCVVVTLPQCTEAAAPVCGGLCPTGELCSSVGDTCECGAAGVPSCGTAIAPACAGLCDVGQACIASGNDCTCLTLPVPTCAESATPLCGGVCSLGSTCGVVGEVCQCTPIPLSPPPLPIPVP